jgi:hypothetical protein
MLMCGMCGQLRASMLSSFQTQALPRLGLSSLAAHAAQHKSDTAVRAPDVASEPRPARPEHKGGCASGPFVVTLIQRLHFREIPNLQEALQAIQVGRRTERSLYGGAGGPQGSVSRLSVASSRESVGCG